MRFFDLLRFMLRQLPGYRWKLSLTMLLGFADLGVLILVPLASAGIIDALVIGSWNDFRWQLTMLAILLLGQSLTGFTHRYVFLRIDERVGSNLRQLINTAVLSKELRFFDRYSVGDITSRITSDTMTIKNSLTSVFMQIVYDAVVLVVVIVILMRMKPELGALTIATAPISLLLGHTARHKLSAATLRVRERIAALSEHLQSWLSRPFALKVHALERESSARFKHRNNALMKDSVSLGTMTGMLIALNTALLGIPSLLIFGVGGYFALKGQLSTGELFAFMSYSAYFNGPIQRLVGTLVTTLPTLYPVHLRLEEFLDPLDVEAQGRHVAGAAIEIEAKEVDFCFDRERGYRLVVPSFVARRGEVVGITGPNGSGKSTLGRLLAGIYYPQAGEIRVDIKDRPVCVTPAHRGLFGFLPQDPVLFDGTLIENITLFSKKIDLDLLSKIADELNLSEWIASLTEGWQTEIRAGLATKLSGGQIQKIGLARLLYLKSPIMILDEAAKGLDRAMDGVVHQILKKFSVDKMVIVITHSQDTLALCDRVYSLRPATSASATYVCEEQTGQPPGIQPLDTRVSIF